MFYKFIFKIGALLRNPSLPKKYQFLKESERWDLQRLQEYQLEQLKKIVTFTYGHSSFYKKQWDAIGFKPSDIASLNDIQKIPIITKKQLLQNNDEIHCDFDFKKVFKASTSGTSGESLVFLREEQADSFNRASYMRGYSWHGVKPWEANTYFWGYNFSFLSKLKVRVLDALQHRQRFFDYSEKGIEQSINKIKKSRYIHGYSSMIYEVAKHYNNANLPIPKKLKMIKGTSEKVYSAYQEEVKKAFGLTIINEYGAAETGIIAFECAYGSMHLNVEGVLVEEIENEIVVTNLQQYSFPIIRYKLGDYIRLNKLGVICKCGLKHPILEEVTGRIGKVVYGIKDTYPSLYFYYIFKNMESKFELKLNYQVVQNEKGKLIVSVEQEVTDAILLKLKEEFYSYFKNDITIVIISNCTINSSHKKQQSFISNVSYE